MEGDTFSKVASSKSIAPPWVFFTFFKFYKWYQIAQRVSYKTCSIILEHESNLPRQLLTLRFYKPLNHSLKIRNHSSTQLNKKRWELS